MRTKVMLGLALLNIFLFGFGYYFLNRVSSELTEARHPNAVPPHVRERLKTNRLRQNSPATNRLSASPGSVAYVTNQFHWSQVESSDYRKYIANLRAIGCPESTIKDIIITDIMKLYAARRGQFYHNGREFHFWETNEKRKLNAKQLEEREKQLAQIDKEIPPVLRKLLGINYERELNKYFVDTNEDERRLSFLSEDKRNRVLALRDEIEGLREQITERIGDSALSDEDREALRKIEERRREALAKILTPEEAEEFELRTSETAERMREHLVGFNPTEDEFRLLYKMIHGLDVKYGENTSEENAERNADVQAIEDQIRAQLGEKRFADYQRSKNADYRNVCLFTELYELPQSTADSIFEIQQIAQREKQNLLADQTIPEDRRIEALRIIRVETEKNLLSVLGTKILSSYTQSSGKWVQELSSAN